MSWWMEMDIQDHLSKSFCHSSHSPRRGKVFASLPSPIMSLHSLIFGTSRWFHLSFSHLVRSLSPAPSLLFSTLAPLLSSCLLPTGLKTDQKMWEFLYIGGDEQQSQAISWLWRVEMPLERGFPIPPAKRAKFKSKLREIKSFVQFQQTSATGEGIIPNGDVT